MELLGLPLMDQAPAAQFEAVSNGGQHAKKAGKIGSRKSVKGVMG